MVEEVIDNYDTYRTHLEAAHRDLNEAHGASPLGNMRTT
jgi:hypothetical protein